MNVELLSDDVGENPLEEIVNGKYTPKFEDRSDLRSVVTHEELESVESRYVESEKLTNLNQSYLMSRRSLAIIISYVWKNYNKQILYSFKSLDQFVKRQNEKTLFIYQTWTVED